MCVFGVCGVCVCGVCMCVCGVCVGGGGAGEGKPGLGEADVLPATRPQTSSSFEVFPSLPPGWTAGPRGPVPPSPHPGTGLATEIFSEYCSPGLISPGGLSQPRKNSDNKPDVLRAETGSRHPLGLVHSQAVCSSASPGVARPPPDSGPPPRAPCTCWARQAHGGCILSSASKPCSRGLRGPPGWVGTRTGVHWW